MNSLFSARKHRQGYTLVEVLAYIVIFSVTVTLCFKLFVTTSRLSAYSIAAVDRANDQREVQRLLLDTIRNASDIVANLGNYQSDDKTLILRVNAPGEAPRFAVLGMLDGRQRLNLMELTETETGLEATKYLTCRLPLKTLRFSVDPSHRLVTADLLPETTRVRQTEARLERRMSVALRAQADKETSHE